VGRTIPYGIYDPGKNRAFVAVGTSHETPAFAVDANALWWNSCGQKTYPQAQELLVLADAGGSNGVRPRAWKYHLQQQLVNAYGLKVTVCHYPPGSSKWNPIEHRLFSQISNNWSGRPLRTYETVLKYIRTTKTQTGLQVNARLLGCFPIYTRKVKRYLSANAATCLDELTNHPTLPASNYTLTPTAM
jgi:hypothetical protein